MCVLCRVSCGTALFACKKKEDFSADEDVIKGSLEIVAARLEDSTIEKKVGRGSVCISR